jgi:hypothetical protein
MKAFYFLCSLQRRFGFAPRIDFRAEETPQALGRKPMQDAASPVVPNA